MIGPLLILLLVLTRIVNLNWGYPYYFHPDENNMALAIDSLKCANFSFFNLKNCFDPHFYAYGQLSLYIASLVNLFVNNANMALRVVSSFCGVISGFLFYKLIKRDFKSKTLALIGLTFFIFTPILIQFSRFGTTESILLLLFLGILSAKNKNIQALLVGISSAIKISSLSLVVILLLSELVTRKTKMRRLVKSLFIALSAFVILSPHYFLNWQSFLSSFSYESLVARGILPVFYTEQFSQTTPIVFQINKILPLAIGWPLIVLGVLGLILIFRKRQFFLPLTFLYLFVTTSFLYVKWARFLVYSYPLLLYFAIFTIRDLIKYKIGRLVVFFVVVFQVLFGLSFMAIYLRQDTRIMADEWINQNISKKAFIISETANVMDTPFAWPNDKYQSNFLYNINSPIDIKQADYVVVPSRRVFANYTCFYFDNNVVKQYRDCTKSSKYPEINRYYQTLFKSGNFKQIKVFESYPTISFLNNTLFRFNDENFEETLTVFDHPVVRIYKRKNSIN